MTSPFAVTTAEEIVSGRNFAQARAAPSVLVLSSPMKVDIALYRGDTGQFRITVTDSDDTPVDISGAAWDGDIRIKAIDVDPVGNFVITVVPGDTSSIDVTLDAETSEILTGTLVYDIEMRVGEDVMTLIYGTISVTQDVSRP